MKMNILYISAGLAACIIVALLLLYNTKTKFRYESRTTPLPDLKNVSAEQWNKLAGAKIFFGHQSVGYNIVRGIEDIIRQSGTVKLNIVEMSRSGDFDKPVFAHAKVGKNMQPISKIEEFVEVMNNGAGDKVDIAFLKFCYVDVTNQSNPSEIFEKYKAAISNLEKRHPRVKFVHFTVPLTTPPKDTKSTIKGFAKWLLGKPAAIDDNLKRLEYNELIRGQYDKTGRFFDLALVESVGPDGLACFVKSNGMKIPVMTPAYTSDGGHLNEHGQKAVAGQLLVKLSETAGETLVQNAK